VIGDYGAAYVFRLSIPYLNEITYGGRRFQLFQPTYAPIIIIVRTEALTYGPETQAFTHHRQR